MIKTLIIEDEEPATDRLIKMLKNTGRNFEILGIIDSVTGAINWFKNNNHPDLVLLDIQLSDGRSFDIFRETELKSFVIFTTAYDEYALKAFELNSIDYLLKPVKQEELNKSIEKYINLSKGLVRHNFNIDEVISFIEQKGISYKKRFVINIGNSIKVIESSETAFIFSSEKNTFLYTNEGKSFPLDFSLDSLEEMLNPEYFFRINRQCIIRYEIIKQIHILSKSRIKLDLKLQTDHEFLVSSTKSAEFRKWLDR